MSGVDEIVKRLSEVTDELLALRDDDFAARFRLETERDMLRDQAAELRPRKDEGRSAEELRSELKARRSELQKLLARSVSTAGSSRDNSVGAGANLGKAVMSAHGVGPIEARIAEIEQELARR